MSKIFFASPRTHLLAHLASAEQTGSFPRQPAVNIRETAENYILDVALPGMKPENVEIQLEGRILAIRAAREDQTAENDRVRLREIHAGTLASAILLPKNVENNQIHASMDAGLLTVRVEKPKSAQPVSIQIQAH